MVLERCGYEKKAVYGFFDASQVWYLWVTEELTILGAQFSTFDKTVFFCSNDDKLARVILVLLDDLLWTGYKNFKIQVIDSFKQKFKVSTVSDDYIYQVGWEIKQDKHAVLVSQKEYAKTTMVLLQTMLRKKITQLKLTTKNCQVLISFSSMEKYPR